MSEPYALRLIDKFCNPLSATEVKDGLQDLANQFTFGNLNQYLNLVLTQHVQEHKK